MVRKRQVGVSENRGPSYSTLNSRILIIREPKIRYPPPLIFGNSQVSELARDMGQALLWAQKLRYCHHPRVLGSCRSLSCFGVAFLPVLGVWGFRRFGCRGTGVKLRLQARRLIHDQASQSCTQSAIPSHESHREDLEKICPPVGARVCGSMGGLRPNVAHFEDKSPMLLVHTSLKQSRMPLVRCIHSLFAFSARARNCCNSSIDTS